MTLKLIERSYKVICLLKLTINLPNTFRLAQEGVLMMLNHITKRK